MQYTMLWLLEKEGKIGIIIYVYVLWRVEGSLYVTNCSLMHLYSYCDLNDSDWCVSRTLYPSCGTTLQYTCVHTIYTYIGGKVCHVYTHAWARYIKVTFW